MSAPARVNVGKQHPEGYEALVALSSVAADAASEAGLEPLLVELVKIRTSQLNGCAFCLRLHTRDALKHGEDPDRLAVLPAWSDTEYFTPEERAALRVAEALVRVGDGGLSDEEYAAVSEVLSAEQLSAVTWVATVMGAFNRVAVASRYAVR
ncbi:carboxymuconolactone decarboxylase family protein [Patulibacter americanus]|uniref:carboxymuconolactone decarboxylase family protein n=1 Tax=Patulibacter americanus TaxID=588672 RepID=UPI0003B3609B|nr:carboxymuconolactone decarboxylase family protein [Patulibacter americanus]